MFFFFFTSIQVRDIIATGRVFLALDFNNTHPRFIFRLGTQPDVFTLSIISRRLAGWSHQLSFYLNLFFSHRFPITFLTQSAYNLVCEVCELISSIHWVMESHVFLISSFFFLYLVRFCNVNGNTLLDKLRGLWAYFLKCFFLLSLW